jgi:hypothetical protein
MEGLEEFLKQYKLVEYVEKEKNIFQIAGFPHYENVSSNVLAYFLKYPIVFESLLNCIEKDRFPYDISECNIENITREKSTKERKRIDILINTDKVIIGIENKIDDPVNDPTVSNPMNDYYEYLKELAKKENKAWKFIVLSKIKVEESENYINILYSDFAKELRKNYSELQKGLGDRYFLLLNEYVENIESFNGGLYMNNEFVEIAKQDGNLKKIEQIMSEGVRLRDGLQKFTDRILDDLKKDNKYFKTVWVDKYPNRIFATVFFQDCFLTDKKYNVSITVHVAVYGFEITIYEQEDQFDDEFDEILGEILQGLDEQYDVLDEGFGDRACYKVIKLEDYDKLIELLKQIFDAFNKYKDKND